MTIIDIYERVRAVKPTEQRQFFNALNDTIVELQGMYEEYRLIPYTHASQVTYATTADFPVVGLSGDRYKDTASGLTYIWNGITYIRAVDSVYALSDVLYIDPLYHPAIVDNVLFIIGAGDMYKSEFIRKSKEAANQQWCIRARGSKVKRARW